MAPATETLGTVGVPAPHVTAVTHYSETQRFRQGWLWALLLVSAVPSGLLGIASITADSDPGTNVPLWTAVILLLVFGPLVVLYRSNLRIEVRDDGLALRLWPLHLRERTVPCTDVESVIVRDISAMSDFGGVGIRFSPRLYRWGVGVRDPVGYIVAGDQGVRVRRRDGPDVVLTSNDPRALAAALERACDRPQD